ncbi:hypothetical protein [Streptomyces thinghirensis]
MVLVGGQADRRPRHRQAPVEHGAIRAGGLVPNRVNSGLCMVASPQS